MNINKGTENFLCEEKNTITETLENSTTGNIQKLNAKKITIKDKEFFEKQITNLNRALEKLAEDNKLVKNDNAKYKEENQVNYNNKSFLGS